MEEDLTALRHMVIKEITINLSQDNKDYLDVLNRLLNVIFMWSQKDNDVK